MPALHTATDNPPMTHPPLFSGAEGEAREPLETSQPAKKTRGTYAPRLTGAARADARKTLLELMLNRLPRHDCERVMQGKHGVSRQQMLSLTREVEAALLEQDRELVPLLKQKQVERLHRHIVRASADKSWNAVVSAERLLAGVQGTLEPVQVQVSVDVSTRDAVTRVLASLPAERVVQLADEQHRLERGESAAAPLSLGSAGSTGLPTARAVPLLDEHPTTD